MVGRQSADMLAGCRESDFSEVEHEGAAFARVRFICERSAARDNMGRPCGHSAARMTKVGVPCRSEEDTWRSASAQDDKKGIALRLGLMTLRTTLGRELQSYALPHLKRRAFPNAVFDIMWHNQARYV